MAAWCWRAGARKVASVCPRKRTRCISSVPEFGFSKAYRLLTPNDYQQVFDRADIKVSSRELLILARCEKQDLPRLGLVIAKKNVRHAVQRNRIKRQIRESFRLSRADFIASAEAGSFNAIVLARRGVDQLDNALLRNQLQHLWKQLQRRAQRLSREPAQPCPPES